MLHYLLCNHVLPIALVFTSPIFQHIYSNTAEFSGTCLKKEKERKIFFVKASQQYLVVYTDIRCYTMREITCINVLTLG